MTEKPESSVPKTRSSARKELFGETYKEVPEYELKFKLPPKIYLLGRMIYLCRTVEKGQNQISRNEASSVVAQEYLRMCILKMHILWQNKSNQTMILS